MYQIIKKLIVQPGKWITQLIKNRIPRIILQLADDNIYYDEMDIALYYKKLFRHEYFAIIKIWIWDKIIKPTNCM